MRMPEWHGDLTIERDEDKLPKHGDASGDPFAEDDGLRIFLGKGVFVEGSESDVTEQLSLWDRLPPRTREAIVSELIGLDGRGLYACATSIRLNQNPGLADLDDPVAYMVRCAQLLKSVRDGLPPVTPDPLTTDTRVVPSLRLTCSYCDSVYVQVPATPNCPNCGAAPRA